MLDSNVNREYKDRLFRFLFGREENKEYALSLYNALNGTSYTNADELEFTTIEDVVYMGMKNDVSFMIQNFMPLYEHQSSFNPNMPLRGLMYFGKLYDRYMEKNHFNRYGKILIKIPTPQYIVFYNGLEEHEEKEILRLSDAFETKDETGGFEWTAIMLNINYGRNRKLMEACKPLREYAIFVERVRESISRLGKEQGIRKAIDDCIRDGILREVLSKNKAEVIGMTLTEYDEQEQMKLFKEEGREEGIQLGIQQGIGQGWEKGLKALVDSLKIFLPDFDALYDAVIKNEDYKNATKEQVRKYYDCSHK